MFVGLTIPVRGVSVTMTYNYDSVGQVTQVDYSNGAVQVFDYDPVGNRLQVSQTPGADCIHDGDVNSSGGLSAADAQLAFYYVLGMQTPTFEEECAADCNSSGRVTAADAQAIFFAVLGIGSCVD